MSARGRLDHVLAAGQSLSLGYAGSPALSTSQPFANLMFAGGVAPGLGIGVGAAELASLVPLVEAGVETMSSAFANLVTELSRSDASSRPRLLVSANGINGTAYAGLKKGTASYATGIAQVRAALAVARAEGVAYAVRAVTNVHGETDHTGGNREYKCDLARWQADYESDVREITAQSEPVPMLMTQVSSFTRWGTATSLIPSAQLAAHVASCGKIVLVGPKYHLEYVDGVHLTNAGYRRMGEDYAKVYARVVLEGGAWEPIRPRSIARSGRVITARFHVPVPPLVLDSALVEDPGHFGFEYAEPSGDSSPADVPKIERVALADSRAAYDEVAITLDREPVHAGGRLRYAHTGEAGAGGGPATGPRGNLRDSDRTPSRHGQPLYNWCVHFDEPVA